MARIRGRAGYKPRPCNKTEVLQWLKTLPLAPEFYPTLEEFNDPIAYIHRIEKEACDYVSYATLAKKTTVMSPEAILNAGIPCCRLVQNPREFVVTFPRAYHSGFSHGFNCSEASNIATSEWLRFAGEAEIRRAAVNYPPLVSHVQLLYDLALSLFSRWSSLHELPRLFNCMI
ncbi:hypothetical protein DCAR_0730086 [Daucus carota subsp. sativus]|uniref:Uncharacterized protein n=1 Tax=Daucus carota subsp. sativus TaxID=79200 RepID=A0A164UNG8_DAUCS|nr:hypothetical protein DCAR_0730086 [Daucus carota subsp. sativus]